MFASKGLCAGRTMNRGEMGAALVEFGEGCGTSILLAL
jgi:hypothetical protein